MTATATDARTGSKLSTFLAQEHARLLDVLDRLLAAMRANAQPESRDLWNELERDLLAHMEAEERFVLPAFAHIDREEALALLREHGAIREQLFLLGIAVDLHYIRYEQAKELAQQLARHAAREQMLLYRWVDEQGGADLIARVERHVAR